MKRSDPGYMKQYRRQNPEIVRAAQGRYREGNWEKIAAYNQASRKKNPPVFHEIKIQSRYGVPPGWYARTLARQDGVCAICRQPEIRKNSNHMCVDHDHRCCPGEKSCGFCVRGLLCYSCNMLLGHAKDSRDILDRATAYLEKHA